MDELNLLPLYRVGIGEIKDGKFIKMPYFCNKRHSSCEKHYEKIYRIEGPHICPCGFTSYVFKNEENNEIFTAFRLSGYFDKKKIKEKVNGESLSPAISNEQLQSTIETYCKVYELNEKYNISTKFIKDIVHEIRNFNSQIVMKSENLIYNIKDGSGGKKIKKKLEPHLNTIRNIFALGSLSFLRFALYDAMVNPEGLKLGNKRPTCIHKKFLKIKRCFEEEALKKNIEMKFHGNSIKEIEAYSTLDLLPYLIFDNAIKYSTNGNNIEVFFDESVDGLKINIKSVGPFLREDEINSVFKKEFRSDEAVKSGASGSGLGLYLAQKISQVHNIDINAKFQSPYSRENKIEYGTFVVELYFCDKI